jgi:ribosomal protein L30E
MITVIIATVVGYVTGAFTPGIERKIKAWYTAKSKAVVVAVVTKALPAAPASVTSEVAKVEAEVKAIL